MPRSEDGAQRGETGRSRRRDRRVPVTPAALSEVALRHLNRAALSKAALAQKLEAWVLARGEPPDVEAARPWIDELVARYERSRLLDDDRLAESAVSSLRAKGRSTRAIAERLARRGVGATAIEKALDAERREHANAELAAAEALVRKRRLGPFRPEAERAAHRRRDLAVLARAGFDYETAIRALATRADDEF